MRRAYDVEERCAARCIRPLQMRLAALPVSLSRGGAPSPPVLIDPMICEILLVIACPMDFSWPLTAAAAAATRATTTRPMPAYSTIV